MGFLKACRAAVKDASLCTAPQANDSERREWSVLMPRTAICRSSTGGRRNGERTAGFVLAVVALSGSRSLRNLCFRNYHHHHHLPSRIPSYHQEPPVSIEPGSVSQTPAGNRNTRAPASKRRGRDIGSIRRRREHVQKERQEEKRKTRTR